MNEPALASEPSRLVRCGPPAAKIVPSSASDGQAQLLGEVVTGRARGAVRPADPHLAALDEHQRVGLVRGGDGRRARERAEHGKCPSAPQ